MLEFLNSWNLPWLLNAAVTIDPSNKYTHTEDIVFFLSSLHPPKRIKKFLFEFFAPRWITAQILAAWQDPLRLEWMLYPATIIIFHTCAVLILTKFHGNYWALAMGQFAAFMSGRRPARYCNPHVILFEVKPGWMEVKCLDNESAFVFASFHMTIFR